MTTATFSLLVHYVVLTLFFTFSLSINNAIKGTFAGNRNNVTGVNGELPQVSLSYRVDRVRYPSPSKRNMRSLGSYM